jgi:hypothetical protein
LEKPIRRCLTLSNKVITYEAANRVQHLFNHFEAVLDILLVSRFAKRPNARQWNAWRIASDHKAQSPSPRDGAFWQPAENYLSAHFLRTTPIVGGRKGDSKKVSLDRVIIFELFMPGCQFWL